jgi:hypothetical protein
MRARVASDAYAEMAKIRLSSALATVLLGMTAGCGSSTTAPPAYVTAADAICTVQLAQLNKLSKPTTATGAIAYLPRAIAIMRHETAQLSTLDPAASKRAQFAAALDSTRRLASALSRFLGQLRTGVVELNTYAQVQAEAGALAAETNAHFRGAGLPRCVS